ncbi:Spy/CpxP family protein refolding chaperone [bacterium]|nr:Spy/CpxP family protein refolding chaperone [bacterium]MBU1883004.1 Spy/CpxP family protein refolding chaperone [bacterium]
MNKKVILSIGSAIVLASTLFAYDMRGNDDMPPRGGQGMPQQGMNQSMNQGQNGNSKMRFEHHQDRFMSTVMRLNLSDAQRDKIKAILDENMKNIPNPNDAFGETSFDKALYVKLSKQRMDNMLEKRADMMENIYKILDDSQKKELKKILDEKPMMKKRFFQNQDDDSGER